MSTITTELVPEVAAMDFICDECQSEIKEGETWYVDNPNAKIYCQECADKK